LDVITLAVPGGREVVAISFWDQKGNAGLQFNGLSRGVEDPGKTTERHEGGG
jgi:hypothetical protein